MKKALTGCILLSILLGWCFFASADYTEPRANATWEFLYHSPENTATLTGYKGGSTAVTIPLTVTFGDDRYVVDGISGACFKDQPITSVSFELREDRTTTCAFINGGAFTNCTALTQINIPKGVYSVGSFDGCTALKSVTLAETVNTITEYAFQNCTSLNAVNLENVHVIGAAAFENTGFESITLPDSITELYSAAFRGCTKLTSVSIADTFTLTSLDGDMFNGCTSLKDVYIPEGFTSLGLRIFAGCTSLKQIHLPESLTGLDERAFDGCTALEIINLPEHLSSIGVLCFTGCDSLGELTIPGSLAVIRENVWPSHLKKLIVQEGITGLSLDSADIEEIELPAGYTMSHNLPSVKKAIIPSLRLLNSARGTLESLTLTDPNGFDTALNAYTALKEINLPDGLTGLPENAFSGCSSLESIHLPSSLQTIGSYAFHECGSLKAISIPDGITSIEYGFQDCTSLAEVSLPDSITDLRYAFQGCTALTDITLPVNVENISYAFEGCSALTSMHVPSSVKSYGYAFSGCSALQHVELDEGLAPEYYGEDYSWGLFRNCAALKSVTIPEGITEISPYTFSGSGVETVQLPETVTAIKSFAFSDCGSLYQVNLPNHVEQISDRAFAGCTALRELDVPDSVTMFGDNCFADDDITLVVNEGSTAWQYAERSNGEIGILFAAPVAIWDGSVTTVSMDHGVMTIIAPESDNTNYYAFHVVDEDGNVVLRTQTTNPEYNLDADESHQYTVTVGLGWSANSIYVGFEDGIRVNSNFNGVIAAPAKWPMSSIQLNSNRHQVLALFEDNEELGLRHEDPFFANVVNDTEMASLYGGAPEWTVEVIESAGAEISWQSLSDTVLHFTIDSYPSQPGTAEVLVTCTWGDDVVSEVYTFEFVQPSSLPTGTNIPDEVTLTVGEQYDLPISFIPADYSFGGENHFGFDIEMFFDWSEDYLNGRLENTFSIVPHTTGTYESKLSMVSGNLAIEKDITFHVVATIKPEFDGEDTYAYALFDDDESIGLTHMVYNTIWVKNENDFRKITEQEPAWRLEILTNTDAEISGEPAEFDNAVFAFAIDRYPSNPCNVTVRVTCEWAERVTTRDYTFRFVRPDHLPTGTNIPDVIYMTVGEQYDLDLDFTPAGYKYDDAASENFGFSFPSMFFDWGSNYSLRTWSAIPHTAGIYPSELSVNCGNMEIRKPVTIYVYQAGGSLIYNDVLTLPASLKEIQAKAFEGADMQKVIIPAGCKTIASRAFADCARLRLIVIPDSVNSIAEDAFEGCEDLVIQCAAGSEAERFAEEHEYLILHD